MTRTCDRCFDNRHIRCRGRNGCSCTYCQREYGRSATIVFDVPEAVPESVEEIMSSPTMKQRKWEGKRDNNGRTPEQQAHYNEMQKKRRQEQRGDPDWLLDKELLVAKIQELFGRVETKCLDDIKAM